MGIRIDPPGTRVPEQPQENKQSKQLDASQLQAGEALRIPIQNAEPTKLVLDTDSGQDVLINAGSVNLFENLTNPSPAKIAINPDVVAKLFEHLKTNDGTQLEALPGPYPNAVEALVNLFDLLPPGMDVTSFLDTLTEYFPGLDADNNGKVSGQELLSAMESWQFPPQNLSSEDGKKLLQFLTEVDPQLQGLIDALKLCDNQQEYATVMKQVTARAVELLQAFYGNSANIQDVSTASFQGADDILFNGVPISLTHHENNWNSTVAWFQSQSPWEPHVGN